MRIKLINGEYLELDLSTPVKKHFLDPYNYTKEILQQFEASIYAKYLTSHDKVILDIGANVGLFALHVSPYAKLTICVEPTPEHMAKQREILEDYPVIHEQAALSDKTGESEFFWCGINTTMNSLQNRGDRSFHVKTITLPDLLAKHMVMYVDFCKIDIEGSEWQAITEKTLQPVADNIEKIFIELHPPDGHSQAYFEQLFKNVGYKVEKVIHDTLFCYR